MHSCEKSFFAFIVDDTFTAKSVNYKNLKTNLQSKKNRIQQTKKPQETLNKENKDVIFEKSTNYLRKILSNDVYIKEGEKQKCFQKSENKETPNSELKNCEQVNFKVLGDHSYFERLDDKTPNRRGMSSLNNVLDNTTGEENVSINLSIDKFNLSIQADNCYNIFQGRKMYISFLSICNTVDKIYIYNSLK